MRQHELGSWPQHCTLFSRCLQRERGTSRTTPVTVLALKVYFGTHCCWLALSLCFSAGRPRQLKSSSAARSRHSHHVTNYGLPPWCCWPTGATRRSLEGAGAVICTSGKARWEVLHAFTGQVLPCCGAQLSCCHCWTGNSSLHRKHL